MKRGTKPTPVHLQLIKGDPRKIGANKLEAKAEREKRLLPRSIPEPPADLLPEAMEEWRRLSSVLHAAGLLTEVDRAALAVYCQAYGRWIKAERALALVAKKDPDFAGLMIRTKSGNYIQNPLVGTANKAMSDLVRVCTEFGMTPASRSRIDGSEPPKEDPAEGYFAS